MLYSEVSGAKVLTSAPKTAPAASPKAPAAPAAAPSSSTSGGSSAAVAGKDEKKGGGAYSISDSMEKLLDRMTGKNPGGFGEAAGSAVDGGSAGNTGLQRAQEAQRVMETALQMAKAAAKGIDSLKSTLGDVLGKLGMPSDRVEDAVGGFGDHLKSKLAEMDFSSMAMDMQQARSMWSIESRGIELKIEDGDRTLSISFAKSTLDFRKEEQSLQASFGQGGDFAFGMSQTTTQVNAKATGIIVRGGGFSDEEIAGILEKLNGMASGGGTAGGAGGAAALTPQKTDKNGIMHLTLDLGALVQPPAASAPAAPAPAAGSSKLLDVSA
ncbi:hypothetical protein [Azospirillum sp. SYSU D00513]|uniref:hypothetical protein n=1 Tax=Azospirillum sp. SYSU D00513 TaxID=2812561 RepID=UPI001A9744B5|nr:hypothetical protein [Azospirillum sp. SYSU D00513]